MQNLSDLSQSLGVLKHVGNFNFSNFKLAYNPFVSTKEFYEYLGNISQLWQKLLFKVSKDRQFIEKLLLPLREED